MTLSSTSLQNLRAPVELDGKKLPRVSTLEFLLILFIGVPFWAVVLVPLLFVYQVLWKTILCNFVLHKSSSAPVKTLKSVVPTPETIVPRDQRTYDVVILGATGFTGTMAVEYLISQYRLNANESNNNDTNDTKNPPIRFAVAGRSLSKLQALQTQLEKTFPSQGDATKVDIVVVDTMIPAQVISMIQTTQAVVNFVGPFQLYGGSIVMEACAKYGTHYVDITGEVDWVKDMLSWSPDGKTTLHDMAKQTGAKLINFCGHDCVPWDLTVFKLQELLQQQNPTEDLIHVTCWDEIYSTPSGGTLATVLSLVAGKDLLQLQQEMAASAEIDPFLKLPDGVTTSAARLVEDMQWWVGKTTPTSSPSLSRLYTYTGPFVMAAINAQLIKRSHILRCGDKKATTLKYREVALYADFKSVVGTTLKVVLGFSFLLLNGIPPIDYLLKKSLPQPGEGPSRASQLRHYLFLVGRGVGSQGTVVETAMYFRKDPGYMDTARMAVESALCMVVPESVAKLPSQSGGGFWTPSTGLGNVLLERLVNSGCTFDSQVVSKRGT